MFFGVTCFAKSCKPVEEQLFDFLTMLIMCVNCWSAAAGVAAGVAVADDVAADDVVAGVIAAAQCFVAGGSIDFTAFNLVFLQNKWVLHNLFAVDAVVAADIAGAVRVSGSVVASTACLTYVTFAQAARGSRHLP